MTHNDLLTGKIAIVTGAGSGIGAATAMLFARRGASVVLVGRNGGRINQVAQQINTQGGVALAIPTDVSDLAAVRNMLTFTHRAGGPVDILVNSAALLAPIGNTWETNPHQWQQLINVNVTGAYFCAHAVLPDMLNKGTGRIINVTSGAANRNGIGWGAYAASKAALDRLTGTLAVEVTAAGSDIVVCGMSPGATNTPMQATLRQTDFPEVEKYQQRHKQGLLNSVEDAARLNLWLASKFGQTQNGSILELNNPEIRQKLVEDLG